MVIILILPSITHLLLISFQSHLPSLQFQKVSILFLLVFKYILMVLQIVIKQILTMLIYSQEIIIVIGHPDITDIP